MEYINFCSTKKTNRGKKIFYQSQQGFILIAVYLVVAVLAIASLSYFAYGSTFIQSAERNQNRMIAFNMAESAVDVALAQIASDSSYAGTGGYVSMDTDSIQGGYAVTVTTPEGEDTSNIRLIQATGYAPSDDADARAAQQSTITAYAELEPSNLFNFGIFADSTLSISPSGNPRKNLAVDSYDSTEGEYDSATAGSEADLGSNCTSASCITVSKTDVKGDAMSGKGSDPSTAITTSKGGTISGTKSASSSSQILTNASTEVASSGDLKISGGTLTLSEGTYHYDSLQVTGNGKISVTGEVKIYVDGIIKISGNGIDNTSKSPPDCIIYSLGSSDVTITGNGSIYAGIYAPNSAVKNTGNGILYGAVVCDTYDQQGNGDFHFDEAMKEVDGTSSEGVSIKSWREENSLTWGTGSTP